MGSSSSTCVVGCSREVDSRAWTWGFFDLLLMCKGKGKGLGAPGIRYVELTSIPSFDLSCVVVFWTCSSIMAIKLLNVSCYIESGYAWCSLKEQLTRLFLHCWGHFKLVRRICNLLRFGCLTTTISQIGQIYVGKCRFLRFGCLTATITRIGRVYVD